MASVLNFERYWTDLNRQLLRRIGYTNGLHKIRRFARVVEYLYPIMPTSVAQLTDVIIREEKKLGDSALKGKDYVQGIIDVARSLLLLERFGTKLALSSQGYACHALNHSQSPESLLDLYLLEKAVETDGEYTLNILRLVAEDYSEVADIGPELMKRFLDLIDFKVMWAESSVRERYAQKVLVGVLRDSRKKLQDALQKDRSRVDFFYKHTVGPRLEWLNDLRCVVYDGKKHSVTSAGDRVLSALRQMRFWTESFIFLPLDGWLATELSLPAFAGEEAKDFSWKLTASCVADVVLPSTIGQDFDLLLDRVKTIYPLVKIANFNEADALSLYEVFAAGEANSGRILENERFESALRELVQQFPSEIFKLSKRRGRGLYVALKQSALTHSGENGMGLSS